LASTKYWHRQNLGIDKILASTKCWRPQNPSVDKTLAQTKGWRRRRRIPFLFGSAESTAADFSFVSLMVLIPLQAVTKCGVASGHPAFMGRLSPTLYPLIVPASHAEKVTNFGTTKYWHPPKIHRFSANYSSLYICSKASYQKVVKTKSDHHHCPISVYTLMTSKIEAILEIRR
jgi:hypothetical protein